MKPTKKNSQLLRREKMIENEFQEQYVLGLTNNQSILFFDIATIELPKVFKKIVCGPLFAFYKAAL